MKLLFLTVFLVNNNRNVIHPSSDTLDIFSYSFVMLPTGQSTVELCN